MTTEKNKVTEELHRISDEAFVGLALRENALMDEKEGRKEAREPVEHTAGDMVDMQPTMPYPEDNSELQAEIEEREERIAELVNELQVQTQKSDKNTSVFRERRKEFEQKIAELVTERYRGVAAYELLTRDADKQAGHIQSQNQEIAVLNGELSKMSADKSLLEKQLKDGSLALDVALTASDLLVVTHKKTIDDMVTKMGELTRHFNDAQDHLDCMNNEVDSIRTSLINKDKTIIYMAEALAKNK